MCYEKNSHYRCHGPAAVRGGLHRDRTEAGSVAQAGAPRGA